MKRKKKKQRYLLHSEYLGFSKPIGIVWFLALVLAYAWAIKDIYLHYQEYHEIYSSDGFICGMISLAYLILFIYYYYTNIKKMILYRFGAKHEAEIIRAKYYEGRYSYQDRYRLVIEFINNKGRKKSLYTQTYNDNPNVHLKSAYCSVYEWKGFCVEGDFQLIEDNEDFERRTPSIPTDLSDVKRSNIELAGYILLYLVLFCILIYLEILAFAYFLNL